MTSPPPRRERQPEPASSTWERIVDVPWVQLGLCCLLLALAVSAFGFLLGNLGRLHPRSLAWLETCFFVPALLAILFGVACGVWAMIRGRKRPRYLWLSAVNIGLLLLAILTMMSSLVVPAIRAGMAAGSGENTAPWKTIVNPTGKFVIDVPPGWEATSVPDVRADAIQVSDAINERYLVALADHRADLVESDVETLAKHRLDQMVETIQGSRVLEQRSLTIRGRPAVEAVVEGAVDNMKLKYLISFVDEPDHVLMVSAWTTPSRFPDDVAMACY